VIVVAIRWYLRYNLSYRDIKELLAERGVEVNHVTVFRWVQRFTPLLAAATRFARHSPGDRWFVDETYVRVNGVWRYVYRAIDQHGQVIDGHGCIERSHDRGRLGPSSHRPALARGCRRGRRSLGSGSRPRSSWSRSAGTCASICPIAT
jgi:hypothetical protein